jgi:hypothetical protein
VTPATGGTAVAVAATEGVESGGVAVAGGMMVATAVGGGWLGVGVAAPEQAASATANTVIGVMVRLLSVLILI